MNIVEEVLRDMRECQDLGASCPQAAYAWVHANHAKVEEYYNNGMSIEDISDHVRLTNPDTEMPIVPNVAKMDMAQQTPPVFSPMPDVPTMSLQMIIGDVVHCTFQEAVSIVENGYSGRGMYGKKCVAIGGSMENCQRAMSQIILRLIDEYTDEVMEVSDEEVESLEKTLGDHIEKLCAWKTDNWGHDIVLYWPEIEYVEGQ